MNKKYIKEFGIKIFIISSLTRVLRKFKLNKALSAYDKFKHKSIIKWLDKKYGKEVNNIENNDNCKIKENDQIWIFWWQGEEKMPAIVKSCYKSVLRNAERHPVILITEKNVKNYIKVPQYIYDKIENKKISLTHFSDILRENLLYEHGGIWMDATIYLTGPFSKELYEYDYYSIKGAFREWNWTGFFQAAGKGNFFAKTISHLFNCYWKEHDCLITYLLIDCFFSVACKRNKEINRLIEILPKLDSSVFLLNDKFLDKEYNKLDMEDLCKKSNLHKLSYKYEHTNRINGTITFWQYLIMEGIYE